MLAIETSCDETGAAVVEKKGEIITVLSNVVSSSVLQHATTGGIIPENAAREQVKLIIPVIESALIQSISEDFKGNSFKHAQQILNNSIDAIAVTYGPGLIGSLLIGVETAKTFSFIFNKPLIPVNHLLAHIFANFINQKPEFPFIGLIVSGGHTDLLLFNSFKKYAWLGGTRDDAAGEALDKIGRILGLAYPAGPEIEKLALYAVKKEFRFSRALINSGDFDFSFSGLKTEVSRYVQKQKKLSKQEIAEISFAVQDSICDVLVNKALAAAEKYNCNTVVLGGGVSANQYLRDKFQKDTHNNTKWNFYFPDKKFTTDNAAMIGTYALLDPTPTSWRKVKASPNLYFA